MRVHFIDNGWDDYLYWFYHDIEVLSRLNELIESAQRTPFHGIGEPEPLKGDLEGFWSRRISREHRIVYVVEGKPGVDQCLIIAMCRYHY